MNINRHNAVIALALLAGGTASCDIAPFAPEAAMVTTVPTADADPNPYPAIARVPRWRARSRPGPPSVSARRQ